MNHVILYKASIRNNIMIAAFGHGPSTARKMHWAATEDEDGVL